MNHHIYQHIDNKNHPQATVFTEREYKDRLVCQVTITTATVIAVVVCQVTERKTTVFVAVVVCEVITFRVK